MSRTLLAVAACVLTSAAIATQANANPKPQCKPITFNIINKTNLDITLIGQGDTKTDLLGQPGYQSKTITASAKKLYGKKCGRFEINVGNHSQYIFVKKYKQLVSAQRHVSIKIVRQDEIHYGPSVVPHLIQYLQREGPKKLLSA